MQRIILLTLVTLLSACQTLSRDAGRQPAADDLAPATVETDVLQDPHALPRTPFQAGDPLPELQHWLNYQLHASGLPRAKLEQYWLLLERQRQRRDTPYARLQFVVVSLHYPARRNLNQLQTLLQNLQKDSGLNPDSQRFARQLELWVTQLQRQEADIAQLNRQLETEKILKQELEEKIRKLSDIEETLNQRQRHREP